MTVLRLLGAALLRALVVLALYVGFVLVLDRIETEDALGSGLLFFLIVATVGCGWGVWDAARRGLAPAALLWLLVGAGVGLGLPAAAVALDDTSASLSEEIRDGWLFFGLLVYVPALIGVLAGGLARRLRA